MDINIDKYIDWYNLTDDYELDSGDISPEDYFKLQEILERYIKTNK